MCKQHRFRNLSYYNMDISTYRSVSILRGGQSSEVLYGACLSITKHFYQQDCTGERRCLCSVTNTLN